MAAPMAAGTAALILGLRAPGATKPNPRAWLPEDVLLRMEDRSAPLCGASLKVIDAMAAVSNTPAPAPGC